MPRTKQENTSPLVQNGKVIPLHIVELMARFEKLVDPYNNTLEMEVERQQIFGASFEDALMLQRAVTEDELYDHIKGVAVKAVEVISEIRDNSDTTTLKEMIELQLEIIDTLTTARAYTTTLCVHQAAAVWGVSVPHDFRVDEEGKVYSAEFPDAD